MDKDNATMEFSSSQPQDGPLDMSKSSAMSQNTNHMLASDYNSRAIKNDELYKDIMDRVNRSREYLESMNKSTLNDNNSSN